MNFPLPEPPEPPSSRTALVEALISEMARRWQAGDKATTEEYLGRHPELAGHAGAAVELIYEEVCLRQQHGEEVDPQQVLQRFPQWAQQLRILLECHELLEGTAVAPRFPEVGEVLGEFRLVAELGRGAVGRVFLASQPALADRPVVLKLVPRVGQEHLSLARLQHTHVVPLYSVQDEPARGLRALCMPYFGGTTLARLLRALAGVPAGGRRGEQFLGALRQAEAGHAIALPVTGPGCALLTRASYAQAVCWIGACLADALHYAADHGLVHLDLKPSNVLLAADGQPMLLDFHLARSPLQAGEPPPDWLGGTPVYMPPEQQLAVTAVRAGQPVPATVDGRADVYSLGVLLYEALGGGLPLPAGRPALALPRRNSQVSTGLARVLDRCLAQRPAERYDNAAALADDLRRHLHDLPLRGVSEGPAERLRKLGRRRPVALALSALLLALLGVGSLAWGYVSNEGHKAQHALEAGREHLGQRQYALAVDDLERGLALVKHLPFQGGLTRQLRVEQTALSLHLLLERLREVYGVDVTASRDLQALEAECGALWGKRALIGERLQGRGKPDGQVATNLLDLAVLWTDLRVRLAGPDGAARAHEEALDVLAQAEAMFGPSCVLHRARAAHAAALGRTDVAQAAESAAASLAPRTAWEHHALGLALLRAGAVSGASAEFDRALDLEPQALWPNFYRGKCACLQGRYEDAVTAFSACVALAPDRAVFAYNRGLAYAGVGRPDRALRDYDRALRLEPSLAAAALSRGTLHYQQKRYGDALLDLMRAKERGASPAVVHYDLALVRLAQGDRAGALADVREALRHAPAHAEARRLQDTLLEDQ